MKSSSNLGKSMGSSSIARRQKRETRGKGITCDSLVVFFLWEMLTGASGALVKVSFYGNNSLLWYA
ncbi:transmembrane protein, putative [Medicago truncatula]|uniref:Transmembrane protein, putative n=1 Tax=Medicago truncatula TaxID=3880 RepID=A0A072VYJ6_MEDTR|nr:transmembrane protein, putative [Medicago truncatula]